MKEEYLINKQNKFVVLVLKSLQIHMDEFMVNLANQDGYETLIYYWAIIQFEEGRSVEEAVKWINEKRINHLFKRDLSPDIKSVIDKRRQRVMYALKKKYAYKKLDLNHKLKIQERIDALIESNLYSYDSIVRMIINIITPKETGLNQLTCSSLGPILDSYKGLSS